MKIAYTGLELPEGKVKCPDPIFVRLVEKFQPDKVSPYFFEFIPDGYEKADATAIHQDSVLDLLILDMEKIESRLQRAVDQKERDALAKCLKHLEEQRPLCDLTLEPEEQAPVDMLSLLSSKPTVIYPEQTPGLERVYRETMAKADVMFFYTVGKQEVHAWFTARNADAVTCAGKIHSDLARGFVRAEIASCEDMLTAHSMQDARARGLTTLVEKDYPIPEHSVIEIRFSV